MSKRIDKEIWREFIENFSSYEGTVTQYCIENNLSKSQFYYHKRRFETPEEISFHAISVKEESVKTINKDNNMNNIRIEIGKANIFIPANEITILSEIIKEIAKSC